MLRFEDPQFLILLAILPLAALLIVISFRKRRKSLEIFGDLGLVTRLAESSRPGRQVAKSILFLFSLALLILAAARPQIGTRMETVKRKGIDIVIALDTSSSMDAEDAGSAGVSRIQKAKREIGGLLDTLEEDRVGVVVFSGVPYIQCPMTVDYDAVKMFLNVVDTNLIPTPGTAIGSAIDMAVKMFDANDKKHKAIILITDGEDHISDPVEATKKAEKEGVMIYTIGIGAPQGTPIPVLDDKGNRTGLKKDRDGNVVMSKLDEATLEKIALLTGGKYFPASLGEMELKRISSEIDKMEKKELAARKYTHFEDRFQIFAGLALFLLLIEALITTGKPSREKKQPKTLRQHQEFVP